MPRLGHQPAAAGISGHAPSLEVELGRALRRTQAERRLPSLSAAVVRNGEIAWADAVGLADVTDGREATTDDQYMVGSITKSFTAAAVLQLRDAGALALGDPLECHLPGVPHGSPTIGQLLSHLSGLQREFPGDIWERLEFPDRETLLASLPDAEQVLGSGEAFHYSNLAFGLLGEVVARRSGLGFERYVEERLLAPLGLARTSWKAQAPAARGTYVHPFTDVAHPEPEVDKRAAAPAGALWSTPSDLCRWAAFLIEPDESVLASRTVEEMHGLRALADQERWSWGYGLGLMLIRDGDRVFAGHGGATVGFRAGLAYARPERTGAAALSNAATGMEMDVAVQLLRGALEAAPADPERWSPGEPPPPEVAGLLGSWWSEGEEHVFRWVRGRLEARRRELPPTIRPWLFEPDGPDRYRAVSGSERGELLRVVRDESGAPVKLYVAGYPFWREPRAFGA